MAHSLLAEVRRHLLDLHKALVDAERRDYERVRGRLPDRDFLDALLRDPALAWLGPLTALIVRFDQMLEEGEPQPNPADPIAEIRKLLRPDAGGAEFQRKYADALQRSPDAVLAHGRTMRTLQAQPTSTGVPPVMRNSSE
jgi:hypothetical protein